MGIQYVEPLSRGIARAKKALFNPLDLKKWFVIGFTAFLAGLADVQVSGGGLPDLNIRKRSKINLEGIFSFPQKAVDWLAQHPGWVIAIAIVTFLFCVLMIIITWLSSRGKFMFLDNVVWDRARVVAPWYEYSKEANSFFLWNLFWLIISAAIGIAYLVLCFMNLRALYESTESGRVLIVPAILAALGLVAISIVSGFIYILLRDFVVPIMYRDRITGWAAILKLFPLFMSHLFHFVGYGILLFCVGLIIVIGIIIFGCVTCCVGFIVLAIPYINAVVLLPISYAMRSFSVEFLEQFGPEYHIFPRPDVSLQAPGE